MYKLLLITPVIIMIQLATNYLIRTDAVSSFALLKQTCQKTYHKDVTVVQKGQIGSHEVHASCLVPAVRVQYVRAVLLSGVASVGQV